MNNNQRNSFKRFSFLYKMYLTINLYIYFGKKNNQNTKNILINYKYIYDLERQFKKKNFSCDVYIDINYNEFKS